MASKRSRRKNTDEILSETQSAVKVGKRAKRMKLEVDTTVERPAKKKKEAAVPKKRGRKKKGEESDVGLHGTSILSPMITPPNSKAKKKKAKVKEKTSKSSSKVVDSPLKMLSPHQRLSFEGAEQPSIRVTPITTSFNKTLKKSSFVGSSPRQPSPKKSKKKPPSDFNSDKRLTFVVPPNPQLAERCDVFAHVCRERNGCLMDTVASVDCFDSREAARKVFQALISPTSEEHFFRDLWEKKPTYLMNRENDYHKGIFSTAELYRILREHELLFTKNIDVTTYMDGKRETHNPTGRAHPYTVSDFYQKGCSIRVLNPQTFSPGLWLLNSRLQEYFNSCVGSNIYLTPAGTQGFAPHYDDIEAFVLQLEGKKRWRLYKPRMSDEILPRESSRNFTEDEIGSPILDVILHPADLLYFPRGTIHQAECLPDTHSLHVTISTYQKNTWSDLLRKVFEESMEVVGQASDIELRKGLPLELGSDFSSSSSERTCKEAVVQKVSALCQRLITPTTVARAVDRVFEGFLHDSLPPCLSEEEKSLTVGGCDPLPRMPESFDHSSSQELIQLDSEVKIVRHGAIRVARCGCDAGEFAKLVYNTENSREYHGKELQSRDITLIEADAVDHLLSVYPNWCMVKDIPLPTDEDKIDLTMELFEKSLLLHKRGKP